MIGNDMKYSAFVNALIEAAGLQKHETLILPILEPKTTLLNIGGIQNVLRKYKPVHSLLNE